MASPTYASGSPWALPSHGVDYNGYAQSPTGNVGDNSFDSSQSRQRRGSSPGKRALNWFSRSRSASPQNVEPPSPTSFIVRNVIKQPGGVSHSGDYHQVKSQPLTTSLGVPPGGPGGGVGYGTALSSNDGRPEQSHTRGRSTSPTRPSSPGAITAGAFRSGRISPGPLSWTQTHLQEEQTKRGPQREQSVPSSQRSTQPIAAPSGPRTSPFQAQQLGGSSPRQSSPLAGSILAPEVSAVSVGAHHSSGFSMPVHLPPGSGPPPIIPLEGVPSPINIPSSPAQAGITPLGSVSPGGIYGQRDQQAKNSPSSPSMASRWMKGLFGKSPRLEERADGMYAASGGEGQWMKQVGTSPNAPYSGKDMHNAWSDGSPLAGSRMRDEMEAEERKKQSMHMAARIEDQHRNEVMRNQKTGGNKPWSPRQVVEAHTEAEWDPPQSKSPPGRKPVPNYSAQDLEQMTEHQREQVASQVDPNDRLSRLEGRLTPAQQIIAETRSRQLAKERRPSKETQVQRGFEPRERGPSSDTRAPTLPSKSPHPSVRRQQDEETPVRRTSKRQAPVNSAAEAASPASHNAVGAKTGPGPASRHGAPSGLLAGNGPMPLDMPMGEALQEMMVRFYRFERYAVPLMRSMEARLVDVERDNQMALQGDAMSENSARDREMDKWVGQMTGLMKHEVGQLKAATREIREGRELLARFASVTAGPRSGFAPARVQEPTAKEVTPSSTDVDLGRAESTRVRQPVEAEDRVGEMQDKPKAGVDHNRTSNFSSATFNSAVPRKLTLDVPGSSSEAEGVPSSASPNGRPRFTSALGQPMQGGRISPATSPIREASLPFSSAPSPSPSNQSASRRAQSVDERLKALMNDKMRSPSVASASTRSASVQEEDDEGEEESDNTSFEKVPSQKIGDNYQIVTTHGSSKNGARMGSDGSAASEQEAAAQQPLHRFPSTAQHLQTPSSHSNRTEATIRKPTSMRRSSGDEGRAVSPTPSRQQSTSPAALSSSNITTAAHATNGLRARAQSYLLNADGSSNPSTPCSPSPSPSPKLSRDMQMPPLPVQPLRVQKSLNSIATKPASDLLGSNAPTIKSSNSSNAPIRSSIRDRVAFFDTPK